MKPEAVIFDMDGVLIDARDWHFQALNEALGIFGYELTYQRHIAQFDGLPTKVKLDLLSKSDGLPEELFNILHSVKQERTLRIAAQQLWPQLQHLILFGWLRSKGMKIAVATNSIRFTSESMLKWAGLLDDLDALVTNEDVSQSKPAPDVYLRAASLLNVDPSHCVAVEDHPAGVEAAEAAGMMVLRVNGPSEVSTAMFTRFFEVGDGFEN